MNMDTLKMTMRQLEDVFDGMSHYEQRRALERLEDEDVICGCDGRQDKEGLVRHYEFLVKLTSGARN